MSGPSHETCRLVDIRDRQECIRCGSPLWGASASRHHRHKRSHPFPGLHQASNLVLLCGSGTTGCHGWVHGHERQSRRMGWIVSAYNDHPEDVPIWTRRHGWVRLDDAGAYMEATPPTDLTDDELQENLKGGGFRG